MKGYPASPKTVGEMIRKCRLDLDLRQIDVAREMGCDADTVTNWELGRSTPDLKYVARIVDFLGFNPFELGNSLGERIGNFRRARSLSQREFARRIAVDQGTLGKWERGERQPAGLFLSAVLAAIEENPAHAPSHTAQKPSCGWPAALVEYRNVNGLSQRQLADSVGVDQTTVARWESGERRPIGLRLKALTAEITKLR